MERQKIMIDTDKCIGCGMCAKVCVAHNIHFRAQPVVARPPEGHVLRDARKGIAIKNKKAEIVLDDCLMCGQCTAICPKKAISISGYHTEQIEKGDHISLNPDDILEVIRFRRTIRHFKQKEISNEIMEQILEAGRLTHTAKNMQDVSYVVLKKEKNRVEQMAVSLFRRIKPLADLFSPMARNNKIDDHFFFFNAPIAIVILAKDKTNGILAAQNMEFVAEAHGLGVLYSGYFTMAANVSHKIKKTIKVPKGKRVAMTLVLGFPDVKFLRSVQRKELDVKYM